MKASLSILIVDDHPGMYRTLKDILESEDYNVVTARSGNEAIARAQERDIDFRDTASLGLELAVTLTDQLDGSIELERSTGTEFTIRFPAPIEVKHHGI